MVLIYIRHGHDNEANAKRVHDTHLTPQGKHKAKKIAKKLIEKYGIPDIIFCSPFARTRETLDVFNKIIYKAIAKEVTNIIDSSLSRYFTSDQQEHPKIHSETKQYHVPIKENREKLSQRIEMHIRNIDNFRLQNPGKNIWVISHGLIIKKICKKRGKNTGDSIGFLQYAKFD